MIEVEVIYKDLSTQKAPLADSHLLQRTDVQWMIVWRDSLVLREKFGPDYYYLLWDDDRLALEGYDKNEVDWVFYNDPEPNKIENRTYFDITPIGIETFANHVVFEAPKVSSEQDWQLAIEKASEVKIGLR